MRFFNKLICLQTTNFEIFFFYIHNRKQGNKLRRLMTFAWPCLVVKNCVDPATKYHGHLLLAHIIAKFAIHKRIVLQVRLDFNQTIQSGLWRWAQILTVIEEYSLVIF